MTTAHVFVGATSAAVVRPVGRSAHLGAGHVDVGVGDPLAGAHLNSVPVESTYWATPPQRRDMRHSGALRRRPSPLGCTHRLGGRRRRGSGPRRLRWAGPGARHCRSRAIALERAAGLHGSVSQTGLFVGAPAAGVLVTVLGAPTVVLVDGISFALAAVLVALLVPVAAQPQQAERQLLSRPRRHCARGLRKPAEGRPRRHLHPAERAWPEAAGGGEVTAWRAVRPPLPCRSCRSRSCGHRPPAIDDEHDCPLQGERRRRALSATRAADHVSVPWRHRAQQSMA